MSHDDFESSVSLWKPLGPQRRGCPNTTAREIVEKHTMRSGAKKRGHWEELTILGE